MMHQISVYTRSKKAEPYTPKGSYERWVSEYAEAYGMTTAEVENLALFKQEKEKLERGK